MNKRERIKELKKKLIPRVKPTKKQKAEDKAARHQLRKLGVYKMSPEGRANISEGLMGHRHSPETIAKISAARRRQCKKGIANPGLLPRKKKRGGVK